jgi:hypothetical protein
MSWLNLKIASDPVFADALLFFADVRYRKQSSGVQETAAIAQQVEQMLFQS